MSRAFHESPNVDIFPIAITMGDAAGIGLEIIAEIFADEDFIAAHPSFVIGDASVLSRTVSTLGLSLEVRKINMLADARMRPDVLDVLEPPDAMLLPDFRTALQTAHQFVGFRANLPCSKGV